MVQKIHLIVTFLLVAGYSTNLFAQTQDTLKKDSLAITRRFENLDTLKERVDKLSSKALSIQKAISAANMKRDSLQKLTNRNSEINQELSRIQRNLKAQNLLLQATNVELGKQKLNYDTLLTNLKTDIKNLSEAKDKYEKLTTQLKKDSAALKKNVDSLKKESNTVSDQIKTQQATIAAQMDSMEVIAQIEMNDSLKIYNRLNLDSAQKKEFLAKIKTGKIKGYEYDVFGNIIQVIKTDIKKVHIHAMEGIMREIVVTTGEGIFRNKSSVIDLVHMDSRVGDTLRYERQKYVRGGQHRYIFLDDVISYTPIQSYGDLPYADFDVTLLPDTSHRLFLLKESTSINTYVNVSAFTDLKGIGGEPNGIAQFSGDAKFITNTRNFRNGATVWLNYVSAIVGIAKYDSKFKGTMLIHKDSIDRESLLQRSTYNVGVKLNLLHGLPSPFPRHLISDWQINLGYNFIGSQVSDTTFKDKAKTVIDTTFRTVTMNEWYIEPSISFVRHRNFGLTLSVPFRAINIKQNSKIKNRSTAYWATPSIDLYYYGKRDVGNKIFFRYHYNTNLKDQTQGYTQMQIGYSLSLTSVWGQKQ